MIHIVFQEADVNVLLKAMEMDEGLKGEIIQIKDDYAVGPINNIYQTEGYQARRNWWMNALEFSPYTEQIHMVDDKLTVHQLLQQLKENEALEAWIWMAQNQHDVCGYYWLIGQLKEYQCRVQVLYLNNLPFINEKGAIFYPGVLHEIQPKEFLKAKRLARPVTISEFEIEPDEWKRLCDENAGVRILEGGKKIVGMDMSFYDKDLMNIITPESQKLLKILNIIFSKSKIKTGDVFLVWRIRVLIDDGKLLHEGDWNKGWKEILIKRPPAEAHPGNITAENERVL